MNNEGNRYGFSSNVDTHMMKNSEWATVSYLSQSKYGKLGNTNFSGANKEVYQNKSNQFITGCSYGAPSNSNTDRGFQYQYNVDINGTGASITGNIYGVYDMSGGSWEYVMANYNDMVGSSGFSEMPPKEYYDKYTTDNILTACSGNECLGHGLSETAGWYNDTRSFISTEYPWLVRGGGTDHNSNHGVFRFDLSLELGTEGVNISFRLVMSPNS